MNTNDFFENAPIPKAYAKLVLPVIVSMAVTMVYNLMDTFFVALTGVTAIVAAVSLCAPLFNLMISLGDIFSMGGSSLVSRLFGERKDKEAKSVSSFSFYAAITSGIILAAIFLIFREPILNILGVTSETYEYARSYYTIIAIGTPFVVMSYTPADLLRCEGKASQAMMTNVVGTVANIILDPIMIFGLHMGVAGAALATVIGNMLTCILGIYIVVKKSEKLSFSIRIPRPTTAQMGIVVAMGVPAALNTLAQSFGTTLINRHLVPYGTDVVAAMGIAMKISLISLLILVGGACGGQPLIGYNYGAGNTERLKKIIRFSMALVVGVAAILAVILIPLAPQLMRIFMDDAAIIQYGTPMLRLLLLTMPLAGAVLVFSTIFQSIGKAVPAIILSISRQGVIFVVVISMMDAIFGYTGVICSQAISDVITAVVGIVIFFALKKAVYKTAK